MEYIGTKFTIAVGGLRLRFVLALEDADDEFEGPSMKAATARSTREHTIHVRR